MATIKLAVRQTAPNKCPFLGNERKNELRNSRPILFARTLNDAEMYLLHLRYLIMILRSDDHRYRSNKFAFLLASVQFAVN